MVTIYLDIQQLNELYAKIGLELAKQIKPPIQEKWTNLNLVVTYFYVFEPLAKHKMLLKKKYTML